MSLNVPKRPHVLHITVHASVTWWSLDTALHKNLSLFYTSALHFWSPTFTGPYSTH